MTKFHILPTTTIIVAYLKEKPVGTLTLFMDSELGLPLEANWEINEKRYDCKFALELGSLAILPEYRKKSGNFFPNDCFYEKKTITNYDIYCANLVITKQVTNE